MKKTLMFILHILSPLPLCAVLWHSDPEKYADPWLLAGMLTGAFAYAWLCAEFVLIARIRFLEREFGLDRFFRYHAVIAIACVALIIAHKQIEESQLGEMTAGTVGNIALLVFAAVCLLAVVFMSDTILMRSHAFFRFRKLTEKRLFGRYEFQVALHNAAAAGLAVMFVHVTMTSGSEASASVKAAYIAYFSGGTLFYLWHRLVKRIILARNPFIVHDVVRHSPVMASLVLVPEKGKVFDYMPGQFGFLRLRSEGLSMQEHPFSISSDPSDRSKLTLTIKALGDYTTGIMKLEPGAKAYLDAPYGRFSCALHPDETSTVLIAGGVGITPALGMLRYLRTKNPERRIILIWGADYERELILREEFDAMKRDMPQFSLIPVLFRDETWAGEKGIVDEEKIGRILGESGLDIQRAGFYICGPAPMLRHVRHALKKIGIKRSNIHFERFSI